MVRATSSSPVRTPPKAIPAAALPLLVAVVLFAGAATPPASKTATSETPPGPTPPIIGIASYYGKEHHGKRTANGEIFDMNQLTAAHPSLPFGIKVRVTHLSNGRSVVVRINDRGPIVAGRIIDLSLAAAERLEMVEAGIVRVKVEVLDAKTQPAK